MFFAGCNGIINTTDDNCIPENLSEQPLQSTSIQRKTECWSDELQELMCTINEEHKSIIKPEINLNLYNKYFPNEEDTSLLRSNSKEKAETISKEQALEDTEYLMDALSSSYSLYTCFDEFDTVWKQIQKIIEQQEIWTYDDFKQVLLEQLNFVKDWHFFIDELSTATATIPFFYKEVEYQKSGDGIYSGEKKVISVDGYDDIDKLFKRSLTTNGDIVYYPITYGTISHAELKEHGKQFETQEVITVHYDDGSSDSLISQPYVVYRPTSDEKLLTYRNDGVPVFYSRDLSSLLFSQAGTELKDYPVIIADVSRNHGGSARYAFSWWSNYTESIVPSNFYSLCGDYAGSDYTTSQVLAVKQEDGVTVEYSHEDNFIPNDNLVIVLSGQITASGGEAFVDLAHNVENTLVIGENTAGCLSSNQGFVAVLKNSGITVQFGGSVIIHPENEFVECYGYEPDLWCLASEAEEAAINFIKKNVQLGK